MLKLNLRNSDAKGTFPRWVHCGNKSNVLTMITRVVLCELVSGALIHGMRTIGDTSRKQILQ